MPINQPHILVIDDDERLLSLIGRYLQKEGFFVSRAPSAQIARNIMSIFTFDIMIVDWMMPKETGIEFTKTLREKGNETPILMLTARAEVDDRIGGLSSGADDYLTKPFDPRELILRVKNIIKRSKSQIQNPIAAKTTIEFGAFSFHLEQSRLFMGEEEIPLTDAEQNALLLLAKAEGEVVSRIELMAEEGDSSGRAVDVLINRLRKKIEQDSSLPKYIHTIRGKGYMLQCKN